MKGYTTPQHVVEDPVTRAICLAQYDRAIEFGRNFKFYDVVPIHADKRQWLETELNKLKNFS